MKRLMAVLVLVLGLWAPLGASPTSVSAGELAARLQAGEKILVVDVRTAAEFAAGHVPGAVNLPHDGISGEEEVLRAWKGRPVLLYCRSGRRAGIAADVLEKKGFSRLEYLQGDMPGWEKDGYPVQK
jgi:phage shock protein E